MEIEKFTLNENKVCMHPLTVFDIKTKMPEYNGRFKILVAEHNGKWNYGYSYNCLKEGGSAGGCKPRFDITYHTPLFDTEKDAILHIVTQMVHNPNGDWSDLDKRIVQALKDYRNNLIFEQLQLFS